MNIAEILKYCPKGTKLYSPIYGNVILNSICLNEKFPIIIKDCKGYEHLLTEHGYYKYNIPELECVLFPSKDQRDWCKFRLPAKRGDIMMTPKNEKAFIFKGYVERDKNSGTFYSDFYCGINQDDDFIIKQDEGCHWTSEFVIPASEEAKKKLFDKTTEAGYKWNADTLELEKVEPKFKEGDVVKDEINNLYLLKGVLDSDNCIQYYCELRNSDNKLNYNEGIITRLNVKKLALTSIVEKNKLLSALVREGYKYDKGQHKLVKWKFKPFNKVLVRDDDNDPWEADIYLGYDESNPFPYICARTIYSICISYEGNEYLLGTTNDIKN